MRNHKKATTLCQWGFRIKERGWGWVECGKAAAYLGSRHLGKHSNTGPHPREHRKRKKTEGFWSRSKYPPQTKQPSSKAHLTS